MYTLPQGVFSETLDYNEGAKIRKEFSSLRSLCGLCGSAVNLSAKQIKPQSRRGRRDYAETTQRKAR